VIQPQQYEFANEEKLKMVLMSRKRVKFDAEKNFSDLESGDPLSGVSAAFRRVRTLYRHGRTRFREVGCDLVAEIPVTIRRRTAINSFSCD